MKVLEKKIADDHGKVKTHTFSLYAAKHLAQSYNLSFRGNAERKIALGSLDDTSIYEAMCEQKAFKTRWRDYVNEHQPARAA